MKSSMNHSRVRYGHIALSFIIAFILHPSSFILPEAARAQVDSIRAGARHAAAPDTGEFHMTKSPLEAVLLSVVIPGAGQVYLEQTWKLPFIYGLIGGFFYGALIQNTRYLYTQDTINNA